MEPKLYKWITAELEQRGWSNNELGRRADISSGHISQIMSGQRPVTFEICLSLAKAFGERPEKILRLAGLLPQSSGKMDDLDKEEAELIQIRRKLSRPRQIAMLETARAIFDRYGDE